MDEICLKTLCGEKKVSVIHCRQEIIGNFCAIFLLQMNLFGILPLCDAKYCSASIFFSSDTVKSHVFEAGEVSPADGHR